MILGAQLYTVHEYTQNLKDFEESLKKISDIGYEYIQVSGTCDFNAKWLRDTLEKYNLKCVLTHIEPDKLMNAIDYVIEDHDIFSCKYIGMGSFPNIWNTELELEEVVDKFKEDFVPAMEKCKASGKYFMFHNHHGEFFKMKNGKTVFQTLIDDIPADILGFTVDTYWVQKGGANPAEFIRSLKGRCPVVHFKDFMMFRDENRDSRYCACGDGILDFKEIIKACAEAGTEYVLVEQDNCFGEDPFACLERSYKYLKSMGL